MGVNIHNLGLGNRASDITSKHKKQAIRTCTHTRIETQTHILCVYHSLKHQKTQHGKIIYKHILVIVILRWHNTYRKPTQLKYDKRLE